MKTYCKPAVCNVESVDFIQPAVHLAFAGKLRKKRAFRRLLLATGAISRAELQAELASGDRHKITAAIDAVALHAAQRIRARDVTFAPVRQFELRDRGKVRQICEESADQQVFEYIAQYALTPLFRAKILPCQYGSIPGKGQVCGKRKLERILRHQLHGKTDAVKCDIKKAYPSTSVEVVMGLLRRDIGKNKPLL